LPVDSRDEGVVTAPAEVSPHRLVAYGHRLWQRCETALRDLERRAPRVIAFLRVIYLPFALVLIGYYAYRSYSQIDLSTIRIWPLVIAFFSALVWWVALGCGWSTLITERIEWGLVRAWCQTQVARYLPGGIWAPIARATTVQGRIRDKAAAVMAENVIVLAAAVGVGALWATVHNPAWLPLVAVVALPTLFSRWLERRSRVTRTGVVRTTATYSFGYVAYGITGILTQLAVSGIRHPTYPLYVAAAACFAWAVGLVVVFAPGGVGVREVVYVWTLHGLYPKAELQAAAITSRLVTVLAELSVLAVISIGSARTRGLAESSTKG
jgi:glycosyltransferase 2 family protein